MEPIKTRERVLALAAEVARLRGLLATAEGELDALLAPLDAAPADSRTQPPQTHVLAMAAGVGRTYASGIAETRRPAALIGPSLAARVVHLLKSQPERVWTAPDIGKALGLEDYNQLRGTLPSLVKKERIVKVERGKFSAPRILPAVAALFDGKPTPARATN